MKVRTRRGKAAVVGFAAALALAACGTEGDGEAAPEAPEEAEEEAAAAGGEFTIQISEPQNLMVGHSTEVNGASVLEQLYSGLTAVDYETGQAVSVVATGWETDDNVTWTFDLRDDFTFHNGEPVTAQTFVDTWNWVVNPDNAQQNANFFDKFVGYDEVVAGEADTMSGVRAVDDYTIEIDLTEPFSPLPVVLSYTAFYPLPEEAFADIESFQQAPIGNGRYMMDGEWEHDVQIAMVRYEDWPGDEPGTADRIVWRIYADINTAYLDVQAGELDILSGIPPERLTTVEQDFGDNWFSSDSSQFTYLGLPLYHDEFTEVNVRHALSLAIDRQSIVDALYNGAFSPATAVIPPVLAQHREDACDYCHFDPDTAA
ncbi:MAG TPA: ABC transporter substrate-binding protein, partial [Jiangellaceae bacterium]|nr:ABC transporter substrate-binding protein [Jiangellaceae bacterium]